MILSSRAPHAPRALAVATVIAVLGTASAVPLHATAAPTGWRALFPLASAYPHGAHLLAVHISTRAATLIDPTTAKQVTGFGFTVGGLQYAALPEGAVASVTVFAFRTTRGADAFLRQDHPMALANPATPGTAVRGLGDEARYVAGACATCGSGAPPLGILLARRGTAVVQILTQPTNHALALRLGHAALQR